MLTRRQLLAQTSIALIGASLSSYAQTEHLEKHTTDKLANSSSSKQKNLYKPVQTLNGWTIPWHNNQGVKECHLIAEPIVQEVAPGMTANLWGYNGSSPGPTIECVEGDRLRIFVTNKLPEHTSIHWHGLILPNGMDGVSGLNQPSIKPGVSGLNWL